MSHERISLHPSRTSKVGSTPIGSHPYYSRTHLFNNNNLHDPSPQRHNKSPLLILQPNKSNSMNSYSPSPVGLTKTQGFGLSRSNESANRSGKSSSYTSRIPFVRRADKIRASTIRLAPARMNYHHRDDDRSVKSDKSALLDSIQQHFATAELSNKRAFDQISDSESASSAASPSSLLLDREVKRRRLASINNCLSSTNEGFHFTSLDQLRRATVYGSPSLITPVNQPKHHTFDCEFSTSSTQSSASIFSPSHAPQQTPIRSPFNDNSSTNSALRRLIPYMSPAQIEARVKEQLTDERCTSLDNLSRPLSVNDDDSICDTFNLNPTSKHNLVDCSSKSVQVSPTTTITKPSPPLHRHVKSVGNQTPLSTEQDPSPVPLPKVGSSSSISRFLSSLDQSSTFSSASRIKSTTVGSNRPGTTSRVERIRSMLSTLPASTAVSNPVGGSHSTTTPALGFGFTTTTSHSTVTTTSASDASTFSGIKSFTTITGVTKTITTNEEEIVTGSSIAPTTSSTSSVTAATTSSIVSTITSDSNPLSFGSAAVGGVTLSSSSSVVPSITINPLPPALFGGSSSALTSSSSSTTASSSLNSSTTTTTNPSSVLFWGGASVNSTNVGPMSTAVTPTNDSTTEQPTSSNRPTTTPSFGFAFNAPVTSIISDTAATTTTNTTAVPFNFTAPSSSSKTVTTSIVTPATPAVTSSSSTCGPLNFSFKGSVSSAQPVITNPAPSTTTISFGGGSTKPTFTPSSFGSTVFGNAGTTTKPFQSITATQTDNVVPPPQPSFSFGQASAKPFSTTEQTGGVIAATTNSTTGRSAFNTLATTTTTTNASATLAFGPASSLFKPANNFAASNTGSSSKMFNFTASTSASSTTTASNANLFNSGVSGTNGFGGAPASSTSTANIFGSGTASTSGINAFSRGTASTSAANIFGGGSTSSTSDSNIFGGGTASSTKSTNAFGGAPATSMYSTNIFGSGTASTSVASVFGSGTASTSVASVFGSGTASSTKGANVFGSGINKTVASLFATTTTTPSTASLLTASASSPNLFNLPSSVNTSQLPTTATTKSLFAFGDKSVSSTANSVFKFGQTPPAPFTATATTTTTTSDFGAKPSNLATNASGVGLFGLQQQPQPSTSSFQFAAVSKTPSSSSGTAGFNFGTAVQSTPVFGSSSGVPQVPPPSAATSSGNNPFVFGCGGPTTAFTADPDGISSGRRSLAKPGRRNRRV